MKRTLALLTSALIAASILVPPAHAAAAEVIVTPDGFSAPRTITAGAVSLRVRSTDPDGAWIGLVRLRPGVALETYLGHLRDAMRDDIEAARAVARDVDMLGGAAVAHVPATVTLPVTAGEYYLVDFRDAGLPDFTARVRPVTARGHAGSFAPAPLIAITGSGYLAPQRIERSFRVINLSRQHNEAMLMPVRPSTRESDLDAFFRPVDAGQRPSGSPFTGGPTGIVPLSPGRSATITADLPPGEYALVTWVRDLRTGRMFAATGMRALLTVGDGN